MINSVPNPTETNEGWAKAALEVMQNITAKNYIELDGSDMIVTNKKEFLKDTIILLENYSKESFMHLKPRNLIQFNFDMAISTIFLTFFASFEYDEEYTFKYAGNTSILDSKEFKQQSENKISYSIAKKNEWGDIYNIVVN